MAATVKTLLEHHGELYWGARTATPGYQYGISLDVVPQGIEAQVVYVLSDLDENDAELIDPEVLLSCYSVADLERNGIVPSDLMDEDESEDGPDARSAEDGAGVPVIGWYCVERSFFDRDRTDELAASNDSLDGYLDIVLSILTITPEEVEAGLPSLDAVSFFDLLDELEGIAERIDSGDLRAPLPFDFTLVNDALLGWQNADEADFR